MRLIERYWNQVSLGQSNTSRSCYECSSESEILRPATMAQLSTPMDAGASLGSRALCLQTASPKTAYYIKKHPCKTYCPSWAPLSYLFLVAFANMGLGVM